MEPLKRKKHRVVVEFDLDFAPELADKVRRAVADSLHASLGYPGNGLNVDYSFNNPLPPKQLMVTVEECNETVGNLGADTDT